MGTRGSRRVSVCGPVPRNSSRTCRARVSYFRIIRTTKRHPPPDASVDVSEMNRWNAIIPRPHNTDYEFSEISWFFLISFMSLSLFFLLVRIFWSWQEGVNGILSWPKSLIFEYPHPSSPLCTCFSQSETTFQRIFCLLE